MIAIAAEVSAARTFAQACFAAFEQRQWRRGLACVDDTALDELAKRYVATRVTPTHQAIPPELLLGFGRDVTRNALQRMPTLDLLTGALDGALAALSENGLSVHRLQFVVRRVEHRIANVYGVQLRVRVAIGGANPVKVRARYSVLARRQPSRWTLDIPLAVYELINIEPPAP